MSALVWKTSVNRWIPVKGLGWLLRHAGEVQYFSVRSRFGTMIPPKGGAVLFARMSNGDAYRCVFASADSLQDWVCRPSLVGLEIYDSCKPAWFVISGKGRGIHLEPVDG